MAAQAVQNLDDYTVDELKEMLDAQSIEYSSTARKADLIGLLEK